MLIPRYYYSHDYDVFLPVLLKYPHTVKKFSKNEELLSYGEQLRSIYYYKSGFVKATLSHENGYEKTLSFHGEGAIFPGCHDLEFQIEKSIGIRALTDVEVLCFDKKVFRQIQMENSDLQQTMFNWYAAYINLLLYETAHQEYNSAFLKLCNLLYLFSRNGPADDHSVIPLTQQELSAILAAERANVSRSLSRLSKEGIIELHRGSLTILQPDKLAVYCSLETLPESG